MADLAFMRPDSSWVVVDFKTDSRPQGEAQYHAQVRLYGQMIQAATGARYLLCV